jgi:phosphatidylethanolamine-binding protein (PEBP) family uncharacterized protein
MRAPTPATAHIPRGQQNRTDQETQQTSGGRYDFGNSLKMYAAPVPPNGSTGGASSGMKPRSRRMRAPTPATAHIPRGQQNRTDQETQQTSEKLTASSAPVTLSGRYDFGNSLKMYAAPVPPNGSTGGASSNARSDSERHHQLLRSRYQRRRRCACRRRRQQQQQSDTSASAPVTLSGRYDFGNSLKMYAAPVPPNGSTGGAPATAHIPRGQQNRTDQETQQTSEKLTASFKVPVANNDRARHRFPYASRRRKPARQATRLRSSEVSRLRSRT